MIKLNLENKEYKLKELMKDCTIYDYQQIQNILDKTENKMYNIFDKLSEVITYLSDIPQEIVDFINIIQLKDIFDRATDIKFDKEKIKIKNSITLNNIKYKTIEEYKEYNDIKLNRLQFRTIKNSNNYILTLAAVVFLEDDERSIKEKLEIKEVTKRYNKVKEIKFKDFMPYIVKWIEVTSQITKDQIDVVKQLNLNV